MNHRLLLLLFYVILASTPLSANEIKEKTGSISGRIVDNESGKAMEYVHVALYSEKDSSLIGGKITDEKGHFELSNVPMGNYYLKIQFVGYTPFLLRNIELTKNKPDINTGPIKLGSLINDIEEIKVTAEKKQIEYKLDKKVINPGSDIIASGGTAIDVLENSPSIEVDMQGNISMRGSKNFKILIDGKETVMDGSDALRSIPAFNIDRIEVITNPSAKYEADGTSGIINVILKKNSNTGLNASASIMTNNRGAFVSSFQANYKKEKVNYHIKIAPKTHKWEYNRDFNRYTLPENELVYNSQTAYEGKYHETYILAGTDIHLSEKSDLSFSAGYKYVDFTRGNLENEMNGGKYKVYKLDEVLDPVEPELNVIFDHKFDSNEHRFTFMGHYSSWLGAHLKELSEYHTSRAYDYNNFSPDTSIITVDENDNHFFKLRGDYKRPLGDGIVLESGFQSNYNLRIADYSIGGTTGEPRNLTPIDSISFSTAFKRLVNSLYTTLSGELIGIEYKLGLRAEHTDRLIVIYDTDQSVPYKKLQLFPTVHLSRSLGEKQQIVASYSKRITRPSSYLLYDFPYITDGNHVNRGRLDIRQEKTSSYELGYHISFEKVDFYNELFYKDTYDPIEYIFHYDSINDIGINTLNNLKRRQSSGIELSINCTPFKWYKLNLTTSGYYFKQENGIEGLPKYSIIKSLNSKMDMTFMFNAKTSLQINLGYQSKAVTAQGTKAPQTTNKIALKRSFLNSSLNINFGVWNLINTVKWQTTRITENIRDEYVYTPTKPYVFLNVSYRLNNYKPPKRVKFEENNYDKGQFD